MASGEKAPDRPGNRKVRLWHYALLAPLILFIASERPREAHGTPPLSLAAMPIDAPMSVMTFNVEGLPPPARFGRSGELGQIGSRLKLLRDDHRQPRIVLLQEAFSGDARRIAAQAGYAYVVDGPTRDQRDASSPAPADIAFAASGDRWKGEGGTKLLSSGLQILSDYPVLSVRRFAFPNYACAGYDCLANKGVVLAWIKVPGATAPIAVAATHLNSELASGVPTHRSEPAYRRQVDLLERFLVAHVPAGTPLIVGGDFNVGEDRGRLAYLQASIARWPHADGTAPIGDALGICARDQACGRSMNSEVRMTMGRIKDLQLLAQGREDALVPQGSAVPFGQEADGTALSDHVGYVVYYRWPSTAQLADRRG